MNKTPLGLATALFSFGLQAQPAEIAQPITITAPTKTIQGPNGPITVKIDSTIPVGTTGSVSPTMQMPPSTEFEVNGAALMERRNGTSELRVLPYPVEPLGGNGRDGAFRIACGVSHMGFFDPIVYPGQNFKSHLHTFFGNSDQNFDTDPETLSTSNSRSTCPGGVMNRSAYWVPSMIDIPTGVPIQPDNANLYYKTGVYTDSGDGQGPQAAFVTAPPPGFRMIAGDPMNSGTGQGTQTLDGETVQIQSRRYDCYHTPAGIAAGKPPISNTQELPGAYCENGGEILQIVFFPSCWDGVNLDSPDHKSHVAYPLANGCPSTHPLAIPVIQYNIHYRVTAQSRPENWRLSSDLYDLSIPGGRSGHGDWNNGWQQEFLQTIVTHCINAHVDCHNTLLGDGRSIY